MVCLWICLKLVLVAPDLLVDEIGVHVHAWSWQIAALTMKYIVGNDQSV